MFKDNNDLLSFSSLKLFIFLFIIACTYYNESLATQHLEEYKAHEYCYELPNKFYFFHLNNYLSTANNKELLNDKFIDFTHYLLPREIYYDFGLRNILRAILELQDNKIRSLIFKSTKDINSNLKLTASMTIIDQPVDSFDDS